MKKLSAKGQKWLKGFHAFFACMWVGGAISLNMKQFFVSPQSGGELYGIMATLDFIDIYIIIPGAVGILLTAVIYSIWTQYGWFKHNWIIVKWVICLYGVLFGTYPLGHWMSTLMHLSKEQGMAALQNAPYLYTQNMLYIFGTFQAAMLVFAVFITTLKPWRHARSRS